MGGVTNSYHYPTTNNLLSSITNTGSTRSFTYTANGNIATDGGSGGNGYSYNNRNRYHTLTTAGTTAATYLYNALGQRVSKTVGSTITHYHYDLQGHLIAESNGSTGADIREYAWLGDIPLAQFDAGGAIYFIHNDQLNTPQKMTNLGATIAWDRIQQPFGSTYSITGSATNNLRFPGQYNDVESGLAYNMMRDYDSTIGRYIEADPNGWEGTSMASLNLYDYADENPLYDSDPLGLYHYVQGAHGPITQSTANLMSCIDI